MYLLRLLYFLLLATLANAACATGQQGEKIGFKGDTLELLSLPLVPYLKQLNGAGVGFFKFTACINKCSVT
jgi:hypothetical protein